MRAPSCWQRRRAEALLFVLLLPVSAQAASVLLVPEDDKARALAADLVDAFSAQKLVVKTAPAGSPAVNCLTKEGEERTTCLTGIGEKAKSIGVFVVSGGLKGASGKLTLELIVNGAVVKKETTRVSKGKVKQQMKGPLWNLIKLLPKADGAAPVDQPKVTVTDKDPDPEPVPVKKDPDPVVKKDPEPVKQDPVVVNDTPKKDEPKLTPPPKKDDDLDLRTPAPKPGKPKVAAWVVTGLTIAAAGTAATFGGLGLAGKGRLEAAPNGESALTYDEAVQLQQ
ncbi:MAG: hypothetical protein JNM17_25235, partial [Archangium sp.]|nr:hypothetical protein [Archangium sp.]